MKAIRFFPVPADVRAIERKAAMTILEAIHRYAETGAGRVKPLSGEFEVCFAFASTWRRSM